MSEFVSSRGEAPLRSFKRGGTKRGKGAAKLHKDEKIAAPKKSKRGRKGGRS